MRIRIEGGPAAADTRIVDADTGLDIPGVRAARITGRVGDFWRAELEFINVRVIGEAFVAPPEIRARAGESLTDWWERVRLPALAPVGGRPW